MVTDNKQIACNKCGNDKFSIRESTLGGFIMECSNCGHGKIFCPDLSARDIISILKEENYEKMHEK